MTDIAATTTETTTAAVEAPAAPAAPKPETRNRKRYTDDKGSFLAIKRHEAHELGLMSLFTADVRAKGASLYLPEADADLYVYAIGQYMPHVTLTIAENRHGQRSVIRTYPLLSAPAAAAPVEVEVEATGTETAVEQTVEAVEDVEQAA